MVKIAEAASEASVSALFSRRQMNTRAYVAETNQHFLTSRLALETIARLKSHAPDSCGLSKSFDYLAVRIRSFIMERKVNHKYSVDD